MNQDSNHIHSITTIAIYRNARSGNNAGGKTLGSPTTVQSSRNAGRRFQSADGTRRRTESIPGTRTEEIVLFVLYIEDGTFPTVLPNDYVIDGADSRRYEVLFVRPYESTLQLDTRRIQ